MLNAYDLSHKRLGTPDKMDIENEAVLSLLELGHMNTVSPSHDPNEEGDCCFVIEEEGLLVRQQDEDYLKLVPSSIFQKLQDEIYQHMDLSLKNSQLQSCSDAYMIYDFITTKTTVDSAIQCLLRDTDHTLDLIHRRGNELLSMARERERFRDLIGTPVQFSPRTFSSSEGLAGNTSFNANDL
jgi:hypothetical protein